jgi:uncharacterized membrane protein YozB (DUF420 family)
MSAQYLPSLNAGLNFVCMLLLLLGYLLIKRGSRQLHKRIMLSALVISALFLISYSIYHVKVGSVPYPYQDWTRIIYYTILIPHIILAAIMVPGIVIAVWYALTERFENHKNLVKWIWPVWMYVSMSGVVIYLMLYQM